MRVRSFVRMGVDGIQGTEGIDEGDAGIHGHGYAQGFGYFLFCGASFERGIGMKGDAAVASRGYGYGNGDKLTDFFAEQRVLGIGGGESLVALKRVR